jgi:putative ATPase
MGNSKYTMDLFTPKEKAHRIEDFVPLAERCRPNRIIDFVGHEEIIGQGTVLRNEILKSRIRSMIFWGPPGVGKTTLAKLIANEVKAEFRSLSAVTSGVKDVREVIEIAGRLRKYNSQNTILFIDEIHRFNKAQQDVLLSAVENGTIILIGATTENPSFEVISPLLSRLQVYPLKILTDENIRTIVERALQTDEILKRKNVKITDWEVLLHLAGGDGRRALNILEKVMNFVPDSGSTIIFNGALYKKAALQKSSLYDKSGEYHYDLISAFIKSIRGSDPDAAIYWMARMLEAGEDPKFIARRMIILASEDIGNADPQALILATSCFTGVNYVGLPEAKIILAQTAAYLSSTFKSNGAVLAINQAIDDVKLLPDLSVPLHLRNAPTSLLREMGYAKGYNYPHDYPHHFVQDQYLPSELKNKVYYQPSSEGREENFLKRLMELWKGIKLYGKDHKNRKR